MRSTCPHCARELFAQRIGEGVRVRYGRAPSFVIASPCPHPSCAKLVFARAPAVPRDGNAALVLTTMADVTSWSPAAFSGIASDWSWPCALLLAFAVIPAWGFHSALDSLRCGGSFWFFSVAGSLLALIPVIFFVRGLACAAYDEVRLARRSRATLRGGGTGGLRLVPDEGTSTYRSY